MHYCSLHVKCELHKVEMNQASAPSLLHCCDTIKGKGLHTQPLISDIICFPLHPQMALCSDLPLNQYLVQGRAEPGFSNVKLMVTGPAWLCKNEISASSKFPAGLKKKEPRLIGLHQCRKKQIRRIQSSPLPHFHHVFDRLTWTTWMLILTNE